MDLGIVYVDDPVAPSLIKIYDPNNLGSTCGSSADPLSGIAAPAGLIGWAG